MGPSRQAPFTFLPQCARACMQKCKNISIHLALLRNFCFLHHHQIVHRLKAITYYRNIGARLGACMHILLQNLFWCILDTDLKIVQIFMKIQVYIAEKLSCVPLPKLRAGTQTLLINSGDQSLNTLRVFSLTDRRTNIQMMLKFNIETVLFTFTSSVYFVPFAEIF